MPKPARVMAKRGGRRGGGRGGRGGRRGGGGGGHRYNNRSSQQNKAKFGVKRGGQKRKAEQQEVEGDGAVAAEGSHAARKKKRLERRAQKPHFELLNEAKQLWESARTKHDNDAEQQRALTRLFALMEGRIVDLIFKHDSSRIIETLLKRGSAKQRAVICDELKGKVLDLCMSQYGRFIAQKLLKYGTRAQKAAFLKEMYGRCARLIRHRDAAKVVEFAFVVVADAQQRATMIEEFFGPDYALLRTPKDRNLGDVLTRCTMAQRKKILSFLSERLQQILAKAKLDVSHSILHCILKEYLLNVDLETAREFIGLIDERIVEMLHTKDGSFVGWLAVSLGTAKQRKHIVRAFKPYASRVFLDEYGHSVALRLLTSVDDTVLLRKALVPELVRCVPDMLYDRNGFRLLSLLLQKPRDVNADGNNAGAAYLEWPTSEQKLPRDLAGAIYGADTRVLLTRAVHVPLVPPSDDASSQVERKLVQVSKKDAAARHAELINEIAPSVQTAALRALPWLASNHLGTPVLDVLFKQKPLGDEAHAELCEALLTLILEGASEEQVQDRARGLQLDFEAPVHAKVAVDGTQGDENDSDEGSDEAEDVDKSSSSSNDEEESDSSGASSKSADNAMETDEPPSELLESAAFGRWLKRLLRDQVPWAPSQKPFGDVLLSRLSGSLAAFAVRPGAAYILLTLLNTVTDKKALRSARSELAKVELPEGAPGVEALAKKLSK